MTTEHKIDYVDANTSYCHTCEREIPNAHVYYHEDTAEIEKEVAKIDEPNQKNSPLSDEEAIKLEVIGKLLVEEWLGGGRQCKVISSGLSGQNSEGAYSIGVTFEGYLSGPFGHRNGEDYRAYLGMVCEDNRVIVKIYYQHPPDDTNTPD